ncbi:MAG: hypothetical protein JXB13_04175 [Phycisphaerae bacterium]|nr:hypothetical protein [Phycisphaerae bacterium]
MPPAETPSRPLERLTQAQWILFLCSAIGFLLLIRIASGACLSLLLDGLPAVGLLAAAGLAGLWLVPLFTSDPLPLRWHVMLGLALGTGLLSLLTLGLGLIGVLYAPVFYILTIAAGIVGLVRLGRILRSTASLSLRHPRREWAFLGVAATRWRWLWLTVVPFAVLGVLAAAVPPGLLWAEEGNGYDVLEYHFQMPREYFEAGRITYAPHNVYANFPANTEMLYLLCMVVRNDVLSGAGMAKMMNLGLAVLCVAAGWLIGRDRSPLTGVVTGVITAGTGWLVYLSGVAYTENAMLFFGLMTAAVLLRGLSLARAAGHVHPSVKRAVGTPARAPILPGLPADAPPSTAVPPGSLPNARPNRHAAFAKDRPSLAWLALAGVLAGLSFGCKYTAGPLIVLPLAVLAFAAPVAGWRRRLAAVGVYVAAACLTMLPWFIKNTAMAGNPVFPLAGEVFTTYPTGWGPEESRHFAACHRSDAELGDRLAMLWQYVPADPDQRFGPLLLLLAMSAVVLTWGERPVRLAVIVLGLQVLMWMFATHLYARFAVPMLIPLVILTSAAIDRSVAVLRGQRAPGFVVGGLVAYLVIIGLGWNLGFIGRLYHTHLPLNDRSVQIEGIPEYFVNGVLRGYEFYKVVNTGDTVPPNGKVLLIGEARAFYFQRQVDYCVVFNRSPFVEAVRAAEGDEGRILEWLRQQGYTHVLVNWAEVYRLRASQYGFPNDVTEDLFVRLTKAGLAPVEPVVDLVFDRPYGWLYRVP